MTKTVLWAKTGSVSLLTTLIATLYAVYQGGALAWQLWATSMSVLALGLLGLAGPLGRIRITRSMSPGPYHVGEHIRVSLDVTLPRGWIWQWLRISDPTRPTNPFQQPLLFVWRSRLRLTYELLLTQRGTLTLAPLEVATGDVFGMFSRNRSLEQDTHIVVLPRALALSTWRLPNLMSTRGQHHRAPNPYTDREPLENSVRNYTLGDPFNRVHWKLTAHSGDLKIRDQRTTYQLPWQIKLDAPEHFCSDAWELAIAVAASFIQLATLQKRVFSVGLYHNPMTAVPSGQGRAHLARSMDWLAHLPVVAEPHQRRPFVPARISPGVIFITGGRGPCHGQEHSLVIPIATPDGPGIEHLEQLPQWIIERPSRAPRHG